MKQKPGLATHHNLKATGLRSMFPEAMRHEKPQNSHKQYPLGQACSHVKGDGNDSASTRVFIMPGNAIFTHCLQRLAGLTVDKEGY